MVYRRNGNLAPKFCLQGSREIAIFNGCSLLNIESFKRERIIEKPSVSHSCGVPKVIFFYFLDPAKDSLNY